MSTTTELSRRAFLKRAAALLFAAWSGRLAVAAGEDPGNFRRVYLDAKLRDRFFLFLQNIFRLYPEAELHQLIRSLTKEDVTDEQVYRGIQKELPKLKTLLGDVTYSLPALKKQKREMARQTLEFLGPEPAVAGFLEIGSVGRYAGELRKRCRMAGPVYIVNDVKPGYGPLDIVERGRVAKAGTFLPMGDYDPIGGPVREGSLDVVANFIGFHHCPASRLDAFVASIRRALKPGGRLIVRDHDVRDEERWALVALAHDVFNAGVKLTWEDNHAQLRLFRSLKDWTSYLTKAGFARSEKALAQAHDPTDNLLVEFRKS